MLRLVGFPFFLVYLFFRLSPTLVSLIEARFGTLLKAACLITIVISIVYISWLSLHSPLPAQMPVVDPNNALYSYQLTLTTRLLDQQPSHRDLLWNAAALAQHLGAATEAAMFLSRFENIDPNSPLLR